MIDTSDILTLANLWNTKLPPFIPLERKEKVPAFVPVLTAMDSDIRVWFQSNLQQHFYLISCMGD